MLVGLFLLSCGTSFAGFNIELDVFSQENAASVRFLHVLAAHNDTLTVFDSLAFGKQNRSSLFFATPQPQTIKIVALTTDEQSVESEWFEVSPRRTTLLVTIQNDKIDVSAKDFRYPRKNENENSYFVFLLIFLLVKLLITILYMSAFRMPKQLIQSISGAFLFSGVIDWIFPVSYLFRILMIMFVECFLIYFSSRKVISLLQTAILSIVVNIAGSGLIALIYMAYVFW
jgi:hypothetical protein